MLLNGFIIRHVMYIAKPFMIGVPKNECLTFNFKGLHKSTTSSFLYIYMIISVMDCCRPIDKMMSCEINKNNLKHFGYYMDFLLSPLY
jgi:hypothetical protein